MADNIASSIESPYSNLEKCLLDQKSQETVLFNIRPGLCSICEVDASSMEIHVAENHFRQAYHCYICYPEPSCYLRLNDVKNHLIQVHGILRPNPWEDYVEPAVAFRDLSSPSDEQSPSDPFLKIKSEVASPLKKSSPLSANESEGASNVDLKASQVSPTSITEKLREMSSSTSCSSRSSRRSTRSHSRSNRSTSSSTSHSTLSNGSSKGTKRTPRSKSRSSSHNEVSFDPRDSGMETRYSSNNGKRIRLNYVNRGRYRNKAYRIGGISRLSSRQKPLRRRGENWTPYESSRSQRNWTDCFYCADPITKTNVWIHVMDKHRRQSFTCSGCNFVFTTMKAYLRHGVKYHGWSEKSTIRRAQVPSELESAYCNSCSSFFFASNYRTVAKHRRCTHCNRGSGALSFICRLCEKCKYSSERELNRHMEKKH